MKHISNAQVQALGLTSKDVIQALEDAFRDSATGDIRWTSKTNIVQPDGAFFINNLGCWKKRGIGIFHNIMGVSASSVPHGAPHYSSVQIVSDYNTGLPLATVDGTFTSTMLPVGVTAILAKHFANPKSKVITFIGAGVQSQMNLAWLKELFPLSDVRILTRTERSASAFSAIIEKMGLKPHVMNDQKAALEGAEIIISTVPGSANLKPVLDPNAVSKGAFISAIDLGRSWLDNKGFEKFDRLVTDDKVQAKGQTAEGRMPIKVEYDTELAEVLTGARPGRKNADERIAFIHPGNLVGVLAITALIYDKVSKQK